MRRERNLSEDEAGAAYGILIVRAGASANEDTRRSFIRYVSTHEQGEWRFMGNLGFGGKFYFDRFGPPRVGCYREDGTPERAAIIENVNATFKEMFVEVGA